MLYVHLEQNEEYLEETFPIEKVVEDMVDEYEFDASTCSPHYEGLVIRLLYFTLEDKKKLNDRLEDILLMKMVVANIFMCIFLLRMIWVWIIGKFVGDPMYEYLTKGL